MIEKSKVKLTIIEMTINQVSVS